ncbi:MAG TPA: hypothetical protein VIJ14_07935 [Rhabdochlamydiaceae bacterium]
MSMEIIDIATFVVGSGFGYGFVLMIFRSGKILQKIEAMDKKIDGIELKIDKLDRKLEVLNDRLTRLEVRVEERTLRVIHTGTENK